MKNFKIAAAVVATLIFGSVSAQTADYYTTAMPGARGSNYLFYKPDSTFADIIKFDDGIAKSELKPVIENYGERAVLFATDSFSIEMDRTTAIYFKAKNGKRELFLSKYANEIPCWTAGAVLYAKPEGKNNITVYLVNTQGKEITKNGEKVSCETPLLQTNIEENYANATGTRAKTDLQKAASGVSVVQEKKVLIIKVSRDALKQFTSLNFKLYNSAKKEVKDFLNIKATESILYINDLPKGKYKYIVEVYDGTLVTEGTITISKK